ncbi:MAG: hypothetical protein OEU50_20155 [Gammaproteobacteria bacterium]|nr:hypothetical protein [Gammaproteobacteria bacterium]
MRRNFAITQSKRSVLFYSAIIFLLQCLAPAFQGVMAKSVNGYTDTLCTMYGSVTVFVSLDEGEPQERPKCWECTACVFQANLNAEPVSHDLRLESRYRLDPDSAVGPLYRITNPTLFPSFLSRAPPA